MKAVFLCLILSTFLHGSCVYGGTLEDLANTLEDGVDKAKNSVVDGANKVKNAVSDACSELLCDNNNPDSTIFDYYCCDDFLETGQCCKKPKGWVYGVSAVVFIAILVAICTCCCCCGCCACCRSAPRGGAVIARPGVSTTVLVHNAQPMGVS